MRAACEAQNEVNGTLTLRDFFVDAVEQSRYFVWGGSGVLTLMLLIVVITSFRLFVAIKRAKKYEELMKEMNGD